MVGNAKHWKMKRDFQFQFLTSMGLMPEHYLLDIGCGTLRGGIPLIEYLHRGHYFGIDVREQALVEGRKELQEAGLVEKQPTLLLSDDLSQLMIDQEFEYIWAFSVLIHMSDDILDQALRFVRKHLSDRGVFYASANIGARKESRWREFPVVWRTLEFYSDECSRNDLVIDDLGPVKDHGYEPESEEYQRMLRVIRDSPTQ
jgi:cyclopropane fatty-acyl-phospholipid synthase-like methyltransferase